ncbi:hypothetical protein BJ165DRAFT_1447722 [Panaeolus papilionaceus]|nr:hypothetical protein BJ165DRAFT_1447722 [Panaeolus papilionaceus]
MERDEFPIFAALEDVIVSDTDVLSGPDTALGDLFLTKIVKRRRKMSSRRIAKKGMKMIRANLDAALAEKKDTEDEINTVDEDKPEASPTLKTKVVKKMDREEYKPPKEG